MRDAEETASLGTIIDALYDSAAERLEIEERLHLHPNPEQRRADALAMLAALPAAPSSMLGCFSLAPAIDEDAIALSHVYAEAKRLASALRLLVQYKAREQTYRELLVIAENLDHLEASSEEEIERERLAAVASREGVAA